MNDDEIRCPACQAPGSEGEAVCAYCGARLAPEPPAEDVDPPAPNLADAGAISWAYQIPLFTNRFIWKDMVIVAAISVAIMQLLVLAFSFFLGEDLVIIPLKVLLLLVAILLGLFVIATLIVLQNRHGATFTVDAKGVGYEAGGRERKLNKALYLLALLSGKPGPIGSVMLARSQEAGFFEWSEIFKVTVHAGPRVVTISNSWRPLLRLYCPPENFERVASLVQGYAAQAAAWRAQSRPVETGLPIKRWIVWTVLCLAAAAGSAAWGWWIDYDNTSRILLLGAILVWASGLFGSLWRRLVGAVAVIVMLYLAAKLGLEAAEPTTCMDSFFRDVPCGSWNRDSELLAVSVAGVASLLIMSLVRLFGSDQK